jgi:hypothetical protein
MISVRRLAGATVFLLVLPTAARAGQRQLLDSPAVARVRHAAKAHAKLTLPNLSLGRPSLDTLELEPMELWAAGAKIVVHGAAGTQSLDPPDALYFRGRVAGEPLSAAFLTVSGNKMSGLVVLGEKRFAIGTAKRIDNPEAVAIADELLGVRELEAADNPSPGDWECDVEGGPVLPAKPKVSSHGESANDGGIANSSYHLRLAIETDYELFVAFNSVGAITDYITALVGNASIVFQRDLNTTLTIGNLHVYSDPQDPWTKTAANGTQAALAELSEIWHIDNARAVIPRSAVVMISGRPFNAGRAFVGTLCGNDTYCGNDGAVCGSPILANTYSGAYAFCGTNGQPTTTVPDPTITRNGVTYGMPNATDYWMLYLFLHEVGHLANGPHTNCVQLTFSERVQYDVTRAYIDECRSGENGCFFGGTSTPAEFGTIMGACHELTDHGDRAARYIFWEPNKPSAKMLPIFRGGLDGSTPDATIHLGTGVPNPNVDDSQPLDCQAGRVARVTACTGCTYDWSIAGGSITGSAAGATISYTPSSPNVTLTITITRPSGCGITTSRMLTTVCASVPAPSTFSATANGGSSVSLVWNAVSGATSYEVWRTSDGTNWTAIGTTPSTAFFDGSVVTGTVYLYRVRGLDAGGAPGANSATDFAAAYNFTDVLAAQSTTIRAAHITELRSAINGLRALVGLAPATFTDTDLLNAPIRRIHVEELRARLAEAMSVQGRTPVSYTDSVLTSTAVVRTAHIGELRAALR